jgi:monoamine oxidase
MTTNNIINVKTVICGAGISGIAAAVNLLKNNYNDFVLLEVNDRIGGRVNTHYYGRISRIEKLTYSLILF